MLLQHVAVSATFSCVDILWFCCCNMSLLHIPSCEHHMIFFWNLSLKHVPLCVSTFKLLSLLFLVGQHAVPVLFDGKETTFNTPATTSTTAAATATTTTWNYCDMFVNFCNSSGHILRHFNFAEIVKSYFHNFTLVLVLNICLYTSLYTFFIVRQKCFEESARQDWKLAWACTEY